MVSLLLSCGYVDWTLVSKYRQNPEHALSKGITTSRQIGIEHIVYNQILFDVMGVMQYTLRDSEEGARNHGQVAQSVYPNCRPALDHKNDVVGILVFMLFDAGAFWGTHEKTREICFVIPVGQEVAYLHVL
jgi:hypothetical protein